ncbi:MAG: hypothetical protein KAH32_01305 [Chlamydiia bacterium]|nr:hypothetical protein [Chlamydiia bacterium]
MTSKQKQFETTIVALHALSYNLQNEEQLINAISFACKTPISQAKISIAISNKIIKNLSSIDELIAGSSKGYQINRISSIEKTIIRAGIFFSTHEGLAKTITISECIRLTKKFGNPQAINFVHAILDHSIK